MPGGGGAGRLVAVPAPGAEGPRPAPPPGLRPHARVRWAQSLWSRVCAGHLRDFRAPGPPNLATGALAAGLVPCLSSPDGPSWLLLPSITAVPECVSSLHVWLSLPSRVGPGQARAGRGSGSVCGPAGASQGWGQALGLWAPSPALPQLVIRSRELGRDGLPGQRGRQQAVGRERERDTEEGDRGAGKSGLSVPRLPSSLRAPPALFGDLAGAALGGPTERQAVRRGHWPTLALCAHLQVESAVV